MDFTGFAFPLADIGATTMLAGVAILIFLGKLVPSNIMNRALNYRENQIERLLTITEKESFRNDRLTALLETLVNQETAATSLVRSVQAVVEDEVQQ